MSFHSVCSTVLLLYTGVVVAQPLGTAFTYQGQLNDSGQPANGVYDLQICLFDTMSNPVPIACAPNFDDVPVEAGVFMIALEFGASVFVGQQRFLELRARPGASSGGFTILDPRQLLRPTPEALHASLASATPWSGLTGMPTVVTSITAGAGLSGGTISGSGTIGIAGGGVGLAQINTTQVQARIAGSCALGSYLRGINADGSAVCAEMPGVNVDTSVDDPANNVGTFTSIAIGTDGLPVISYRDNTAGALKVAKCANTACTGAAVITTVDDPANDVGDHASIAIGTDGRPVVSYRDNTAGALKVAKCANPACTGAATITTVDDPPNNVGAFTSIAIGSDGLPVVSYLDGTSAALKVAKCGNAACTGTATITTVDDPAGIVGFYTSIAIGMDGLPVISYYDFTAGALKVAKCGNAACTGVATITAVDDPANSVGEYTSIAIGSDGFPVISYRDNTALALKIAKCGDAACSGGATVTTVDDPANNVGAFTSIAIGTDALPVVSYYDLTAGALKVAQCANAACTGVATITVVDDQVHTSGAYTSIAIGVDGLPVISYTDVTAGALKVAKCRRRSCQ